MNGLSRTLALVIAIGGWFGAGASAHAGDPARGADYLVYVTAESADQVYLVAFDGQEARVAKRIDVGYQPTEIEGPHGLTVSPDGRHWFVTMAHGKPFGILYEYETGTDRLVGKTELGLFPATMQISKATGLLYCVNFDLHGDMRPSTVSIVDPDAMTEVARVTTGPMPHGSRLSPDGRKHYSCAMMSDQLFEIDAATFEVSRVLDLDEKPAHEAGEHEHAGHEGHPGHPMSKPTWVFPHPSRLAVYVALNGIAQIAEVDLNAWRISRRFATGKGPYNVEVTQDGSKLVATYKSEAAIGVWDLDRGVELARLPSSRRVTHGVVIAPDSRYAFVSSEGIGGEHGSLDVVDLQSNAKVASVELGLQAGGIAFWKIEPKAQ